MRADKTLFERGLARSRTHARELIERGAVELNGARLERAAQGVKAEDRLDISAHSIDFASRAGLKLEAALERFDIEVKNRVALDIGSSVGGFVDVLQLRGARPIYAVESGTVRLRDSLRRCSTIIALERVDARALDRALVPDSVEFCSCDVSFISATKVLPLELLSPGADLVVLVKPQFERTTPRAPLDRAQAVERVSNFLRAHSCEIIDSMPSPVCVAKGRFREQFLYARKL